jgi:predicted nucleotidyltransferase
MTLEKNQLIDRQKGRSKMLNLKTRPPKCDPKMEQILVDLKKSLQEITGDRLIKMVLYGSRARGDFSEDSDTDIAIVIRGLSPEMKRRMLSRVADIEFEYLRSLSTLILSEEDFLLLRKRERRIAVDIEREGIPL